MHYTALQPVPAPDSESQPFWDAARDGRLAIQRCTRCQHVRYPPTTFCPICQSSDVEWIDCSGHGQVYSWIVVRRPIPAAAYETEVPYVVALIALEEGPRIAANVVHCDPAAIFADMPVRVAFEPAADGFVMPVFQPVRREETAG